MMRNIVRCVATMLLLPAALASAQTPVPRPHATEVRIASEPGVVLAGTLETPGTGAGPFPVAVAVAVIVAGTGPWTRGGFVAIRARLLAGGVATLDFDKRGQGRSTGAFVDTLPAMERDVAAIVTFLRSQPHINPERIVLIGQSQGAVARARDGAAAAFVAAGFPPAQAQEFLRTLDTPVVLSMFDAAPDRAVAALRMPVLAIYGTRDTVIAPTLSFAAATAALGRNPDALVVAVPGMTHELRRADPSPGSIAVGADATLPVVVDTVAAFLFPRLRNQR